MSDRIDYLHLTLAATATIRTFLVSHCHDLVIFDSGLSHVIIIISVSRKMSTSKAAVGFDAGEQKMLVISPEQIEEAEVKPEVGIDLLVDGRSLTILQVYDSIEEAKSACEENTLSLNDLGISSITYDDEPQSSSSGTDGRDEEQEVNNTIENENEVEMECDANEPPMVEMNFSVLADLQMQVDEMRTAMRNVVSLTMNDLQLDIERLNQRQQRIMSFFKKSFGTERDGRIIEPFSIKVAEKRSDDPFSNIEETILSEFEVVEEMTRRRMEEARKLLKNTSSRPSASKQNARPAVSKREREIKDGSTERSRSSGDYSFGNSNTQGKRIVNGVVHRVDSLSYPFISEEEELECLESSNGFAPIYAQLLAKLLFKNTIELYFKDQDTAKRNWLHDAVDYRFPTLEKAAHVSKWKNCSFFINKNMREAVLASGNPMPRAPCGPRGPIGPKAKSEKTDSTDESGDEQETMEGADDDMKDDQPKMKATEKSVLREVQPKSRADSVDHKSTKGVSKPPSSFTYLSASYEKECFDDCRGDQYKYAELMALRLFSDSLELKFKEQDVTKKEWLRHCVESRFPITDRDRNDQRWKICGQTCNRNRTKIVGEDGREEKFPYFAEEEEEECFEKSGGVPSVYAELMNAKLFPDTQHLFFKDQDIGRRNWLHSILDKRFPSVDKCQQVSKWKQCTNAINRKLFDGTVTPITKEAVLNETIEDPKESSTSTPKTSIPRFERRPPMEANGSLKRKLDETSTDPSPGAKRESIRNKIKKEREMYTAYPFITENEEIAIYENSNMNPQVYGRELGRVLFKDSIQLYFKDQDPDKRQWIREIIDFRFPSKNPAENKQKWKNVSAAINRNMNSTPTNAIHRKSISK